MGYNRKDSSYVLKTPVLDAICGKGTSTTTPKLSRFHKETTLTVIKSAPPLHNGWCKPTNGGDLEKVVCTSESFYATVDQNCSLAIAKSRMVACSKLLGLQSTEQDLVAPRN